MVHVKSTVQHNAHESLGVAKFAMQEERGASLPHIVHATCSKAVKGEDILWVHPYVDAGFALFMICDGHSGSEAASYVTSHFHRILSSRMPKPLPEFSDDVAVKDYAEKIRKAITETFVKIDNEWARLGQMAGTTVTIAVVTGWLLTVANTGDSIAILDSPNGFMEMVSSHRIQLNDVEQDRLRRAGAQIAPLGFHLQGPAKPDEMGVGPLRLWPGGLCVSRSIGDLDAGPLVVPVPHIRQVILPTTGARAILASDGLWDVVSVAKVSKLTRSKTPEAACATLLSTTSRDRRLADDISIIILDMLPDSSSTFPTMVHGAGHVPTAEPKPKGGGFFSCFKPSTPQYTPPASRSDIAPIKLYADVDCLMEYPNMQNNLARTSMRVNPLGGHRGDYTMHGTTEARVFHPQPRASAPPRALPTAVEESSNGTTAGAIANGVAAEGVPADGAAAPQAVAANGVRT